MSLPVSLPMAGLMRRLTLAICAVALIVVSAPGIASGFYVDDHETLIASKTAGEPSEIGTAESSLHGVSENGRYIVFNSRSENFPGGSAPLPLKVEKGAALFRKDLETGTLELVARPTLQEESTIKFCGTVSGSNSGISADGRYVAFTTTEPLDPADTNYNLDVYVRDMSKALGATKAEDGPGAWELVSARDGGDTPAGYQAAFTATNCGESFEAGSVLPSGEVISADGRRVAFITQLTASNLPNLTSAEVPPAGGARARSLFWRDLDNDQTRAVAREVLAADGTVLPDPEGKIHTDAGQPVGTKGGFQATPVSTVAISGDGAKVAWVGKYAPRQARILPQEYGEASKQLNWNHLMWRDMSLGKDGVTRRVSPLIDFDDPGCDQVALEALTFEALRDPEQQGPCFGPLLQCCANGAEAGDVALSHDGLTAAWTLEGSPRPNTTTGNEVEDVWVTSMAPGVSRKEGTRVVTEGVDQGIPETGADILGVALSGDGRRLAFRTNRTKFSSLVAPSPVGTFPASVGIQNVFRVTLAADRTPEQLELITRAFDGGELTTGSNSGAGLAFSADGQTIAFDSGADKLVKGDSNEEVDVFVSVLSPKSCEFIPTPAHCLPSEENGGDGGGGGDAVLPPPPGGPGPVTCPKGKVLKDGKCEMSKAQRIQEQRRKALAKCRKVKDQARKRKCIKKANAIGRKQAGRSTRSR